MSTQYEIHIFQQKSKDQKKFTFEKEKMQRELISVHGAMLG